MYIYRKSIIIELKLIKLCLCWGARMLLEVVAAIMRVGMMLCCAFSVGRNLEFM